MQRIRNFAIIAHVDHGKSTLADRLLELTGVVEKGHHEAQMLDKNPISRERGITIKLAPVRMKYRYKPDSGVVTNAPPQNDVILASEASYSPVPGDARPESSQSEYILNLIDTPGHVDFSYEVERTLACVEGALLLVDATQGIQAQTIAHTYKAVEQNLTIIPVLNKIDVPHADIVGVKKQIVDFLGVEESDIFEISAKTGEGVEELLKTIIEKIPSPHVIASEAKQSLHHTGIAILRQAQDRLPRNDDKALIFDSYFDSYRGVIAFVRIFDGEFKKNMKVKLVATGQTFEIEEVGIFTPSLKSKETLENGEIGYVVTKLKDIHLVRVGDTILDVMCENIALPGYRPTKPMVYASVFPTDPDDFVRLKESLEKLALNDSSLTFSGIFSKALGSGFRTGFLGLLHADVVRERLEREFDLSIILSPPTVEYKENVKSQMSNVKSEFEEPIADVMIVAPQEYTGAVMRLAEESRGIFKTMDNKHQVFLHYEIPLAEIITTFFDQLKTITSGYASFDWAFKEYRSCDAGLLTIMLNSDPVEEFSEYVVHERAFKRARYITDKLKELIPRQQYEVKIQALYKGKIIASSRVAPFRKDVTQKLYGGDRTRKDKLLKKQKAGKKLMKNIGRVEIPKDVFLKLFKN